jgi:hypothetical protein
MKFLLLLLIPLFLIACMTDPEKQGKTYEVDCALKVDSTSYIDSTKTQAQHSSCVWNEPQPPAGSK